MMLLAQAKRVVDRASRATQAALRVFEHRYEPSKHYMRGPGPKSREAAMRGDSAGGQTEAPAHG